MNALNPTPLPAPVAQYIDFANRFDAVGAAGCFTPDAIVRDEQKEHVGRAAIEQWIAQTSQASQPNVTVSSIVDLATTVKVVGRVAGNFPGSPLDLDFEFYLQDGKIAQLTIQ